MVVFLIGVTNGSNAFHGVWLLHELLPRGFILFRGFDWLLIFGYLFFVAVFPFFIPLCKFAGNKVLNLVLKWFSWIKEGFKEEKPPILPEKDLTEDKIK